jgi:hypothetical protein
MRLRFYFRETYIFDANVEKIATAAQRILNHILEVSHSLFLWKTFCNDTSTEQINNYR